MVATQPVRAALLLALALALGSLSGASAAERWQGTGAAAWMWAEEGSVYLDVARQGRLDDGGGDGAVPRGGWVEVWQEGHYLVLNTSEDQASFEVHGTDTYMWASVFDDRGRWIGESNVVHVLQEPPLSLAITHGRNGAEWSPGRPIEWPQGDRLHFTFEVSLATGHSQGSLDAVIVLINNQTHGMMHLSGPAGSMSLSGEGTSSTSFQYVHQGEVEVGLHRLQVAGIEPGVSVPRVLSPVAWFDVTPQRVPRHFNSSSLFLDMAGSSGANQESDLSPSPQHQQACALAFAQCFTAAASRIPPNRQVTEVADAADSCALRHCNLSRQPTDALIRNLAFPCLISMLDEHMSSVLVASMVPESLLRASRVLQLLGDSANAQRALRTTLRIVGYRTIPSAEQCTYPGCQEISKDACGLLHRLMLEAHALASHERNQRQQDLGGVQGHGGGTSTRVDDSGDWGSRASAEGYMRHLDCIIPAPAMQAQQEATVLRYPLSQISFGVLTTQSNYRARADVIKRTWWQHVQHGGFYGDEADASLPITPYAVLEEEGMIQESERLVLREHVYRADYLSSMPKFFLMLHDLVRRCPHCEWFLVAGDDNFVVPHHIPLLLQALNSSEKIIAGGPIGRHIGVGRYPSGGSGILFSRGFVDAASRHIAPFAVSWLLGRGQRYLCHPCGDIAFGVFARDIGARVEELPCMHGMWPEYFSLHTSEAVPACASLVGLAPQPRVTCSAPASFHYVQPRSMLLLARFFFQHRPAALAN